MIIAFAACSRNHGVREDHPFNAYNYYDSGQLNNELHLAEISLPSRKFGLQARFGVYPDVRWACHIGAERSGRGVRARRRMGREVALAQAGSACARLDKNACKFQNVRPR